MKQVFILSVAVFLSVNLFANPNKIPGEGSTKLTPMARLEVASIDTGGIVNTTVATSFPDEMIDEIFGPNLDSLITDWYIRSAFNIDSFSFGDTCVSNLIQNDFDDPGRQTAGSLLPDSVYMQRLKDIDSYVDLSYNSVVRDVIQMYSVRKKKQVGMMLGLANYYFPMFEEIFDRYQLPLELKYLAIIESALNPRGFSRVGACGLWQFMLGTGRMYGLEVNTFIDERRDPLKSTEAAAKYLKELYSMYGDWHMVIAAYNCGPGTVNKAIKRTGGKTSYWDIYYYLPKETRSYVPAFIAASYIMNYYKLHGIFPVQPNFPIITDTIMVNNYLNLEQVANQLDVDINILREINPIYRRDIIPAKPEKRYPLCLPQDKINRFIESEPAIFAYERDKYFPNNQIKNPGSLKGSNEHFIPVELKGKDLVYYSVKTGDNVGFIAEWFNIRVADLRYWNNLRGNLIKAGQKLSIYVPKGKAEYYGRFNQMSFDEKQLAIGKSTASATKTDQTLAAGNPAKETGFVYHTVQRGDNLWGIAKKYPGVTAEDIKQLNNITDTHGLSIGQTLKIKKID